MDDKTKFRIVVDKMCAHQWSFGLCVSRSDSETYLFINFFHWTISIGKLSY